jgi:hypothetical protein
MVVPPRTFFSCGIRKRLRPAETAGLTFQLSEFPLRITFVDRVKGRGRFCRERAGHASRFRHPFARRSSLRTEGKRDGMHAAIGVLMPAARHGS